MTESTLHPVDRPIGLQIRFERFPASIRGAFVIRGADGNPHAVRFDWATLARIPSGLSRPIVLEDRIIDVTPVRDLFVPFEVGVGDLEPAWYRLQCSAKVDGASSWEFQGRPFSVPWVRSEVRRGTIPVHQRIRVGSADVLVERIELGWDAAAVCWVPQGEQDVDGQALLSADGEPLESLPLEASSKLSEAVAAGERRSLSYPIPRRTHMLSVAFRLPSGQTSEPLTVSLL